MPLGLISNLSRSVSMAYTGAWSQGLPDNLAMYCSIVVMAVLGVPLGAHMTSNIDRESLTTALIWLVFAAGLQAMGVFPPKNTFDVFIFSLALLWTVALGCHVMRSRTRSMRALAKMEEDAKSDGGAGGGRKSEPLASLDQVKIESRAG